MLAGLVVDANDLETMVNRDRGRRGMRVLNMKNGMEEDGTQAAMGLDLFNERHETVAVTTVEEGRLAIAQAHPPIGSCSKKLGLSHARESPMTHWVWAAEFPTVAHRLPEEATTSTIRLACQRPGSVRSPIFFPLVLGSAPPTQTEECHMLRTFGIDRYYGMLFTDDLDRGMAFHMSLSAEFLAKKSHPCSFQGTASKF